MCERWDAMRREQEALKLLFPCEDHETFNADCHGCFLAEYGEIEEL